MPFRRGEHQRIALGFGHLLNQRQGLGVDGLLHTLPLTVERAKLLCQLLRQHGIVAQQQVGRLVRRAHASGGIDARRQHEADLHGGNILVAKTGFTQQRMQADEIGAVDGSQTPGDDGAVFAGHLHHIRHRADSGQGAVAGK